jgi:hypothetical protein
MTDPRPRTEQELIEQIRAIDVPAPDSLRRQVESLIAARSSRGRRAGFPHVDATPPSRSGRTRPFSVRPRLAAGGAVAAALVALAVVVGLSGSSSSLSVHDAAVLTLRPATSAPPAERSPDSRELAAAVDGVWFPYWGERLGWRSSGSRRDHVDGRAVTTVFYEDRSGRRIGYAIVAGAAPSQVSGGVVSMRDGTAYRLQTIDGSAVVTWLRHGHLCVVSGRGVSGATLLRLASWDEHRSVAA